METELAGKKILVTGGTGHLGSAIIHYLVKEKAVAPKNIRVFYLKDSPANSLNDISGLEFFAGNILNEEDVAHAFQNVQLVFHTVGSTTFDPRQKKLQWQVNVEGTRNVLNASLNSPTFEKLCYTSTVNVLGVPNPVGSVGNFETSNPYINLPSQHTFRSREEVLNFTEHTNRHEDDWWNAIGIGYYDSKLAAQELVNEYFERHKLNVVSLLPGTMFGPYDYLIGTGLYLLSVYNNKMPAVIKGAGLPLAHVMDVARGHVLAMEKATAGAQYILSGKEEDNRSLKEMVQIISEVLSAKFPEQKFNRNPLEVPFALAYLAAFFSEQYAKRFNKPMLLSTDAVCAGRNPLFYTSMKAKRELGYKPHFTFREAVSDMLDYYITNGLLEREGRWIDRR